MVCFMLKALKYNLNLNSRQCFLLKLTDYTSYQGKFKPANFSSNFINGIAPPRSSGQLTL